jgi:hypothetical protein
MDPVWDPFGFESLDVSQSLIQNSCFTKKWFLGMIHAVAPLRGLYSIFNLALLKKKNVSLLRSVQALSDVKGL